MSGIEHHTVAVNGGTFHVAVAGPTDAPPVFLLHGFPEGWMSWRDVMLRLASKHRVFAPDLRGYPSPELSVPLPRDGYRIFELIEDIRAMLGALAVRHPFLVGHDWGGALAWIFAHRHSSLLSGVAVVNCTHPRTLMRAILHCDDWQTFRVPWLPFFQIPKLPEWCMTTDLGRRLLRWSFTVREGSAGAMNRTLVDELVARFRTPDDMYGPIQYYREMVAAHLVGRRRRALFAVYDRPITVPATLIWGLEDGALSWKVARRSGMDALCNVALRPLPGIGHFVNLEAVEPLTVELERAIGQRLG